MLYQSLSVIQTRYCRGPQVRISRDGQTHSAATATVASQKERRITVMRTASCGGSRYDGGARLGDLSSSSILRQTTESVNLRSGTLDPTNLNKAL
jgi:hypothetical protein